MFNDSQNLAENATAKGIKHSMACLPNRNKTVHQMLLNVCCTKKSVANWFFFRQLCCYCLLQWNSTLNTSSKTVLRSSRSQIFFLFCKFNKNVKIVNFRRKTEEYEKEIRKRKRKLKNKTSSCTVTIKPNN